MHVHLEEKLCSKAMCTVIVWQVAAVLMDDFGSFTPLYVPQNCVIPDCVSGAQHRCSAYV